MKKDIINVSRRDFLITTGKVGSGLTLGLYLSACSEDTTNAAKLSDGVTEVSDGIAK